MGIVPLRDIRALEVRFSKGMGAGYGDWLETSNKG
jgi:hypothetical protein